MSAPLVHHCTATDPSTREQCTNTTELYLCQDHALELEELIQEAGFLWACLDPVMQATKSTRPANQGPGASGAKQWTPPVPDAAVGLDKDGIRLWLLNYAGYKAWDIAAHHADAHQFLNHARYIINQARTLVHGAKAQEPTSQGYIHARLRLAQCEPMRSSDLRHWFAKHGIRIKAKQLNNWVARGQIVGNRTDPTNPKEHPTYEPTQVYFAYLHHNDKRPLDNRRHRMKE